MNFLNGLTINLDKLPKYISFLGKYTIDIDNQAIQFLKNCINSDDPVFKPEIKERIQYIINNIKQNKMIVEHQQRLDVGRFYPNKNLSLVTLSRHVKHSIFNLLNWIDIDMIKGHPTIIYNLFKSKGTELKAFKKYIENPTKILNELIKFYSPENQLLTEDNVKDIFNISIYGGGFNTWLKQMDDENHNLSTDKIHPFIEEFINECKIVMNSIVRANPKLREKIVDSTEGKNDYQIDCRVVSYFCQAIENEIVYMAYKFLKNNGIIQHKRNVELEYDGLCFLLPNGYTNDEIEEKVTELNTLILEETKFDIKFKVKPYNKRHIHSELYPKEEDLLIKDKILTDFEEKKSQFEKSVCKITNKSVFVKQTDDGRNIIMSRTQLVTSYEHMCYEKEVKGVMITENFINDWLKNCPTQHQYEDMGIYPKGVVCPKNHYNLWTPFAMEKIKEYIEKPDELKIILKHIYIMCGNDVNVYEYIIKWIGQMLVHPSIKTTCPTFISKQGAGKTTLLKLISKMIGEDKYLETTQPSRDVWGNFNGIMSNCFFVNLNELSKKESMESDNKIKGLITDSSLTINSKGVNQFKIISYHRFMATTNSEDGGLKTYKDDRRNLIIRSSDELIGNKDYFEKIYEMLEDVNVIKTCYEYFIKLDGLDKFHKLPLPITEYQENLKELTKSPIDMWLEDFTLLNYDKEDVVLLGNEIYNSFKSWSDKQNMNYDINALKLGVRLTNMKIDGIKKGEHTKNGKTKIFNISKLKEHYGINLLL